jgi:uncharacterized protein YjiS (DUF1127 family)
MFGVSKADLIYAVLALCLVGVARNVFFTIVGAVADRTGFWRWYQRRRIRMALAQLSDPKWQDLQRRAMREWADELHELVEDLKAAKGAQTRV